MSYDPYLGAVVLYLKGDGSNNGTTFTDSSPRGKTATRYGTPVTSTASSKFGTASLYFDGNGDYLEYADSTDFEFGAGTDFTVEAWVRRLGNSAGAQVSLIVCKRGAGGTSAYQLSINDTTGSLSFDIWDSANTGYNPIVSPGLTWDTNTWYHVAACRQGTNWYLWRDGVSVATGTSSVAIRDTTDTFTVGGWSAFSGQRGFNGYIDELRVTRGIARYTSAFTPPNQPFFTVGCLLLMNMNGSDNGTTFTDSLCKQNATITGTVVTKTATKKWGTASMYQNNTSGYLTSPTPINLGASAEFMVECWIYFTDLSSVRPIFFNGTSTSDNNRIQAAVQTDGAIEIYMNDASGNQARAKSSPGTIAVNTWYHVMFCRDFNGFIYTWVDGKLKASARNVLWNSTGSSLYVGMCRAGGTIQNGYGYIDGFRVYNTCLIDCEGAFVNEYDPYWYRATFIAMNFDTNGAITPQQNYGYPVTVNGSAVMSTAQSKFGGGSMLFNGTTQYLSFINSSYWEYDFATWYFTIEMWLRPAAVGTLQTIVTTQNKQANPNNYWSLSLQADGTLRWYSTVAGADIIDVHTNGTLVNNTWYHVAVVRQNCHTTPEIQIYIDGVLNQTTVSDNVNAIYNGNNTIYIGTNINASGLAENFYNGYMDDFRLTAGWARYP